MLIAGTVIGNIRASESAHLLAGAHVTGNIAYARLSIAPGAQVNGTLSELARSADAVERPARLIRLADKTQDAAVPVEQRG